MTGDGPAYPDATPPARRAEPDTLPDAAATPASAHPHLSPPEAADEIGRLGGYRVLGVLGEGGMGVVYRAEDPALGRPVALKVMRPGLAASADSRERFVREARAAAALEHERVVPVYQVGEDGGVPFLAMPLLRGESLEARLRREPQPPLAEVLRIGRETAEGLAAAHAAGLVHRDVKPSNVWLRQPPAEGVAAPPRVVLLDFGLARARGAADGLTRTGLILGTPAYMAPEQARGKAEPRSDLFSLGCVLYRMATGEPPFRGPDTMAVLTAVALDSPPPPRSLNPDVPAALEVLVVRLLAKDPASRPASAREVVAALRALEDSDDTSTLLAPAAPPPRRPPRPTRRRWLAGAGALAAAGLGVGGLFAWLRRGGAARIASFSVQGAAPGPGNIFTPKSSLFLNTDRLPLGWAIHAEIGLDGPGYAYVFAFSPGGTPELRYPDDPNVPPPQAAKIKSSGWLPKQLGMHAVVAVASGRPLPAFAEWSAGRGPLPWPESRVELCHQFRDGRLELMTGRGGAVQIAASPAEALADVLRTFPEETAFVAFPVVDAGK